MKGSTGRDGGNNREKIKSGSFYRKAGNRDVSPISTNFAIDKLKQVSANRQNDISPLNQIPISSDFKKRSQSTMKRAPSHSRNESYDLRQFKEQMSNTQNHLSYHQQAQAIQNSLKRRVQNQIKNGIKQEIQISDCASTKNIDQRTEKTPNSRSFTSHNASNYLVKFQDEHVQTPVSGGNTNLSSNKISKGNISNSHIGIQQLLSQNEKKLKNGSKKLIKHRREKSSENFSANLQNKSKSQQLSQSQYQENNNSNSESQQIDISSENIYIKKGNINLGKKNSQHSQKTNAHQNQSKKNQSRKESAKRISTYDGNQVQHQNNYLTNYSIFNDQKSTKNIKQQKKYSQQQQQQNISNSNVQTTTSYSGIQQQQLQQQQQQQQLLQFQKQSQSQKFQGSSSLSFNASTQEQFISQTIFDQNLCSQDNGVEEMHYYFVQFQQNAKKWMQRVELNNINKQ
ncbi:hypothetical protein PPERSA_00016 [Pseudocohnilembus persalinus]|uniref:Uncharacterized protein n=1 Tax=Pseudocohnilembus persalinus TaxID=266149 RepID=A0A0V0QW15_PSEPJ|nr:hypothetical protein PPERSA_00016 [Pseudocohnilembus persalinus]|eukprot:KRX06136.1 hypothetical protein PPERSA_00016 [Pseudocohnilembus persalinus]